MAEAMFIGSKLGTYWSIPSPEDTAVGPEPFFPKS